MKWESNPIYPCIISRVWLMNEGCWYLGFVLTIVPYNTYDILHSFSPAHILITILYPSIVHVYPLYVCIVHVYPLYCSILTSTFCCSIYCVGTYAHFNLTGYFITLFCLSFFEHHELHIIILFSFRCFNTHSKMTKNIIILDAKLRNHSFPSGHLTWLIWGL